MAVAAQSLPKRAAIYVRVSSPKQEDNFSLSSQEKSCREYAAERGYVVLEEHVYREVFSAEDIWDRPNLTRLRGAIEHELVDIVIAHEPKRLSRDPDDTIFLAVEARRRGIQYELATRPPDNSPYAGLIRYLDGLQGKNERLDMIERAGRGRRERAEAGLPMPGGKPPYGYRWKPDIVLPGRKRRTPKPGWDEDPETSWVVKRIFEEAARGHGQRRIAEGLNRDGIRPPAGGPQWHQSSVRCILHNSAYGGKAAAWRVETVRDPRRTTKCKFTRRRRAESEQIPLPVGTAPALIDQAVFTAVQERLRLNKERAARSNREPEQTLLRGGYAHCGYCGSTMFVHRGRKRLSYRCTRRQWLKACRGATIAVEPLDQAAWAKVEALLLKPELIAQELQRLERQDPTEADLVAVDRQIAQVERRRRNLLGHLGLLDPDSAEHVRQQLVESSERLKELRAEREAVLAQRMARQQAHGRLAELEAWCRAVAVNLGVLTYEQRRLALDALGVRTRVWQPDCEARFTIETSIPLNGEVVSSPSGSTSQGRITRPQAGRRRDPR